jgi:hypothetical protein
MPHLFRATREQGEYVWRPLEYVEASASREAFATTLGWFAGEEKLLEGVAETLDREGALDAFGLAVSHGREEIPCHEGEVLVEETDEATRTLVMRPYDLHELAGTTTPTLWSTDDGQVRMTCRCMKDQSGSHIHGHIR